MKRSFVALFFMLCMNIGVLIVEGTIGPTQIVTTLNTTQAETGYNASDIVNTWVWGSDQGLYGDIPATLAYFWGLIETLVVGFPDLLTSFGAPTIVKTGLNVLWVFIMLILVLEIMGGRNITGE